MADGDTAASENTNPWDSDLAVVFEDEETRNAVSEFLGDKVQPYVTKLEQESKPERDATLLWEQFHEEPVATTIQVIRELYGEEKADAFTSILQGEGAEAPESGDVTKETETTDKPITEGTEDTSVKFEQLPPEVQEIVQAQKLEESKKAYYGEIDRIREEHKDELPKDEDGKPRLEADMFHPFVVAAEGNFDEAYKGFQSWVKTAMKEAGVNTEEATSNTEAPPTTIDSKTRDASAQVPATKTNQTLDSAMDEMFEELKAPPPTVGAV